MALFRIDDESLTEIKTTTLAKERMREESDLERLLRKNPDAVEADLFIITEQFSYWQYASREIDMLGMDRDGRLVVIELKRDDSGRFMDLQAIRYAAMVANITTEKLIEALKAKKPEDAEAFESELTRRSETDETFAMDSGFPRIVLVAGDFNRELTTSVLWLNEIGSAADDLYLYLDITCIRARPYRIDDSNLVLDVETLIPQADYAIKLREQRAAAREGRDRSRNESTARVLERADIIKPGTVIVVDPTKMANGVHVVDRDPRYRAKFADPVIAPKNVVWESDGQVYSLTALTRKLRDEFNLRVTASDNFNGYGYWCLESAPTKPLYEMARTLTGAARTPVA